jgi:predicted phage terminase large subunit-like protein
MFKRAWFGIMPAAPAGLQKVRSWDLAATDGGGDQTVGLLMGKDAAGFFYILDVIRLRGSAHDVEQTIVSTAKIDGKAIKIRIPQDPGQAGKSQVEYLTRQLQGYIVVTERETGSKETRAMPLASQCEARNIKLIEGPWLPGFLEEIEVFPMGAHDDQVDAASGAFLELSSASGPMIFSDAFLRRAAQPMRRGA